MRRFYLVGRPGLLLVLARAARSSKIPSSVEVGWFHQMRVKTGVRCFAEVIRLPNPLSAIRKMRSPTASAGKPIRRQRLLTKYDGAGNLLWTRQLGSTVNDRSLSVALDAAVNAYISGYTDGSLGGPNAGGHEAFLVKFVIPELPGDFNHDGTVDAADYVM